MYKRTKTCSFIILYVDDMLIAGTNKSDVEEVVDKIEGYFKIKRIGIPKKILGLRINIQYDNNNQMKISLDCPEKIQSLIQYARPDSYIYSHISPAPIPINPSIKFSVNGICGKTYEDYSSEALSAEEITIFRSIIGQATFLSMTFRPDISYAVSLLSRYMVDPKRSHLKAAKQLTSYLQGTMNYRLVFRKSYTNAEFTLSAYTDSDWGSNVATRRSQTGGIVYLGRCPVMWTSIQQSRVALSTAEAELNALKDVTRQVLYFRELFAEIKGEVQQTTNIYIDNIAALELAQIGNQAYRNNKYIDMSYKFVNENIVDFKTIMLKYIESKHNIADIFTKPLEEHIFKYLSKFLCLEY